MSELLEIKNVSHVYGVGTPFEKRALDRVDFSFEKREFIGLIGHTGSGKSTLIQHINGLLKPTEGQVLIKRADIWGENKNLRQVRFLAGMVFQYPEYQLFEETVYRDIAFGPVNKGLSEEEVRESVLEALRFVDLPESILEKSPFSLSGGQKRRVAIAGVIAMKPEILILDEPTAGLDPRGRDQIMSHIKGYHAQTGAAVLFVTHNMEEIAKAVSRAVVLSHGRVIMDDVPEAVFGRTDMLRQSGLNVPQITQVFLRMREMGACVDTSLYTTDQAVKYLLSQKGVGGGA